MKVGKIKIPSREYYDTLDKELAAALASVRIIEARENLDTDEMEILAIGDTFEDVLGPSEAKSYVLRDGSYVKVGAVSPTARSEYEVALSVTIPIVERVVASSSEDAIAISKKEVARIYPHATGVSVTVIS